MNAAFDMFHESVTLSSGSPFLVDDGTTKDTVVCEKGFVRI
jgi:hypothetical protein